jgi:hypothetical protein
MKLEREGKVSSAPATKDETRREALKRFGRYASAAPAAMVLLQSRRGEAAPPPHVDLPSQAYRNPHY